MDTRKFRASSNIEDQRETPAQRLGRHIGLTQQVKEAMGNLMPMDTNPRGWESVNKDYSQEADKKDKQ